ncbi:septum formation initiator family protein [Iamia sp.]|uniref:FtsB family cell division protein n=1 Tax=Iamia sp. TaxID=2722710 RepID=UPI002BBD60EF|nr:septum formation initiator family protein [Iamia sp.]HXH56011.1 septum formation initiator family protein [Iamia sp.]
MAAGLVASVALVGFLLVGVFPTRDWLAQRDQTATQRAELDAVEDDQRRLEERIARLQTPEEVEQIAREEYGMARPGERPFRILPPAVAPVELPDTWPFVGAEDWLNR